MNKLGLYYSYWIQDWQSPNSTFVRDVAELGFDIFEVNPGRILSAGQEEKDRLKAAAAEYGIELTYTTALAPDLDISSENAQARADGIEFLRNNLRLIAELGGGALSGVIYGAWNRQLNGPVSEKPAYVERSVASMREVMKTAEDLNVNCNVEVLNRYEQFILNTSAEAVDYVHAVGSPNLGIHLDTYHMNIEEDRFDEAILTAGEHLGHFHVGENNRRLPGKGHIPWTEVFAALKKSGYAGPVVIEPFIQHEGTVASSVKLWRDIKKDEDLKVEARRCLDFLRAHLQG